VPKRKTLVIQYQDTDNRRDYRRLSDEQCIRLAKQGDRWAADELVKRYHPMVVQMAKQVKAPGMDLGDFIQVGHLAILEAIHRYDCRYQTVFSTLAYQVIWSRLLHAIDGANRRKYEVLNNALSLEDYLRDEDSPNLLDNRKEAHCLLDPDVNVEDTVINRCYDQQLLTQVRKLLSAEEFMIFLLLTEGNQLIDIARQLRRSRARISEVMCCIRKKLQLWLEEAIHRRDPIVCHEGSRLLAYHQALISSSNSLLHRPWEADLEGRPKAQECCLELLSYLQSRGPTTSSELYLAFKGKFSTNTVYSALEYLIRRGFLDRRVEKQGRTRVSFISIKKVPGD